MLRQDFHDFIFSTSTDGNGKASSCVRALDMLGPILTRHYPYPVINGTMWQRFSLADIQAIHKWICAEMKKGAAKDFKTFRFEDLEDHVAELAFAEINAVHEWICAEDSEKGCCQALFYVRRTIQNGWNCDVLRNWLSTDLYEREGNMIPPRGILGCDVLCTSMSKAALFVRGSQTNGKAFWQKM